MAPRKIAIARLQTPAHARRQPTSLPMSAIALAPSLTLSCWWPSAASRMHARRWRIRPKSSVPRVSTYSRRWAAVGEQTRVDDYLHAFYRHQRSEERCVGNVLVSTFDLGCRRFHKKKKQ